MSFCLFENINSLFKKRKKENLFKDKRWSWNLCMQVNRLGLNISVQAVWICYCHSLVVCVDGVLGRGKHLLNHVTGAGLHQGKEGEPDVVSVPLQHPTGIILHLYSTHKSRVTWGKGEGAYNAIRDYQIYQVWLTQCERGQTGLAGAGSVESDQTIE